MFKQIYQEQSNKVKQLKKKNISQVFLLCVSFPLRATFIAVQFYSSNLRQDLPLDQSITGLIKPSPPSFFFVFFLHQNQWRAETSEPFQTA